MTEVNETLAKEEATLNDNLAAGLGIPEDQIQVTTLDKVFTKAPEEVPRDAVAASEEITPVEETPAAVEEPAVPTEPELYGSKKLAETIDIKGNIVTAKEVVQYAFAKSKMQVEIWNKLSTPKREALITEAIEDLRKQLKPVPKNQDGKPKLSLEEKARIKESKYKKEIAGQQWAGLAALKGQIQYAPDPDAGKKEKPKGAGIRMMSKSAMEKARK